MSRPRKKKRKRGPPGPDTFEGRAHRADLKEKASKGLNSLFFKTREPPIPPNTGEELKPYEGEEIE